MLGKILAGSQLTSQEIASKQKTAVCADHNTPKIRDELDEN
jgi:hypothetical protein